MVFKKAFMMSCNYASNTIQNELKINYCGTNQIIAYYTLTSLLGVSIKNALFICMFL